MFVAALAMALAALAQSNLPPIKWRTLLEGSASKMTQFETHFLYGSGDLQTYSRKAWGTLEPPRPVTVDWNTQMVIAVHLGTRNTGGYSVYVETIARTSAATGTVFVVEKSPPSGGVVTQAMTSPWVMVVIDRTAVSEWKFERRKLSNVIVVPGGCMCGIPGCTCRAHGGSDEGVRQRLNWFEMLREGTSLARGALTMVIDRERSFRDYWLANLGEATLPDRSGVNWQRDQLAAIHLGRTTRGESVQITRVARMIGGFVEVRYRIVRDSRQAGAVRSPFVLVRLPQTGEPVRFRLDADCTCPTR